MTNQINFSQIEFAHKRKRTKKEIFFEKMEKYVPLEAWCEITRPYYYEKGNGREPIGLAIMLKMYLVSNWFNLSDPQTEDILNENMAVRKYVGLSGDAPDETTLCKFRKMLEENGLTERFFNHLKDVLIENKVLLKEGTIVDASFIEAPNSIKNKDKQPNPNMRNGKKGKKHFFGMKVHVGVDKNSGLVHSVATTTANESDLANMHAALHGEEKGVWGDSGYVGAEQRIEICEKYQDGTGEYEGKHKKSNTPLLRKRADISFHVNKKLGKVITDEDKEEERLKSKVRSKVEHVFCAIKHTFGFRKTRLRTIEKNHAKLLMMAALSNVLRCSQRNIAVV
jgi:IS5 family transposase